MPHRLENTKGDIMNEKDTINIKKRTGIFAVLAMLIVIAIISSALVIATPYANKKPKYIDSTEGGYGAIEYLGKKYTYFTNYLNLFDYKLDKKIGKNKVIFPITFYTLKNDPNKNFIYVSEWQNSRIYTCLDIDIDYFTRPDNPKAIELTINDKAISITDEEYINYFQKIKNAKGFGFKKIRYNPEECTIIKSRPIIKGSYPIEYTYKDDAFIYNGEQWLVAGEIYFADDGYSTIIYYGYPFNAYENESEMQSAFQNIAEKYFPEIYNESIDYEEGFVIPEEEVIIDPEMATMAD